MSSKKDIPEFTLEEWKSQLYLMIQKKLHRFNKAVVAVSGAPTSGKSEASEQLKDYLEKRGHKCLIIGMDNFYKGVAEMIIEKTKKDIKKLGIDIDSFSFYIKLITRNNPFNEKLSSEVIIKIKNYLKKKYPKINSQEIIIKLTKAFKEISFDSPDVFNKNLFLQIIKDLKLNKLVRIPIYSMEYSEIIGKRKVRGADYDILIIEGMYILFDQAIPFYDILSFVEADSKTLLMRRFRRDVLFKKTTFLPEQVLKIMLQNVLPSYKKHVLPQRKEVDLILKNNFSKIESFDVEHYDVQDKIAVSEEKLISLESKWGRPDHVLIQEDYFIGDEESTENTEHLLRIRVENGKLKNFIRKGIRITRDDGKIIRPTEQYIKDNEFGLIYNTPEKLLNDIKKAGLKIVLTLTKTRKVFKYDGIEINSDRVSGLGTFIELSTNDKLSKAQEIDKFKEKFDLINGKLVGPYADEMWNKLSLRPEKVIKTENLLNLNITKNLVLKNKLALVMDKNKIIKNNLNVLRRGYPSSPFSSQCSGKEFRKTAHIIFDELAKIAIQEIPSTEKTSILLQWKSGLPLAQSFLKEGINDFYHLSLLRDIETLKTKVDYFKGEIKKENFLIITNPILATGNTVCEMVSDMKRRGISEKNILIVSLIAAPIGIYKIKKEYPLLKIITGALGEKLDYKGYIVSGIGDFDAKYFFRMSEKDLNNFINFFPLDKRGKEKLTQRLKSQTVGEVLTDLVERDFKDMEIDKDNKAKLKLEGLKTKKPKEFLEIDTGKITGVENVVKVIISRIRDEHKIFSLEGMSGTGKTTTAVLLQKKIKAVKFSMSEVFRYLTYSSDKEKNYSKIISRLSYKLIKNELFLFDGNKNITKSLVKELRSPKINKNVPRVSSLTQGITIRFVTEEMEKFRNSKSKILLEGRGYSLDFLPSDLRIKLIADPGIRAERRWSQNNFS